MDNATGKRIVEGVVIIVLVGIIAKLTAFFTETILAAYLGTSYKSDAYYMVASIKDVLYPMLSVGIWQVFLPLYKTHIAKGERDTAYVLTNKALSFFAVCSAAVVLLLLVFAPAAVSIVAPGFAGDTRSLCIRLVRISAPMYVPIIASAIYASMLQCHEKFLGSQIREVASHIPTIIAAIFFYKRFGIDAMAIALIASGVFRLLIELPFVDWGYRFKPDFHLRTQEFALMLKRLPSALISAGVVQINTLIDKAMASTLPTGTISGLSYGHKLTNVLSGLLSSAIATAMYPQMIEWITQEKKGELAKLVTKVINIFCVLMVPITIACVLFRTEIVSAVFERGAFDGSSTALTASVFALYSLGLFFTACSSVISNIFYGHGDTKTAMHISVANLGINVVLNLALIHLWGVNGLALATSLSSIITFYIRLVVAKKYVKLDGSRVLYTGIKTVAAALIACLTPRVLFWAYPVNKYIILLISAIIGALLYYLLVKAFRVSEIDDLISLAKRKIRKR